ncbi:acyl carrier protein [Streptomyces sp. UNOB3_S3]|uniref:acyl carrier protein n=1 Tax=Streptomyces sp. UNOB3_S3 TaxID=2871682 RepID=UPI0035AE4F0F|nr:hypothetical protein [Streptomyces sp. UNOB3_S3]
MAGPKVDGTALTTTSRARPSGSTAAASASSGASGSSGWIEAVLGDAWKEVLGLTDIDADEDFHALGDDSLSAIALLTRRSPEEPRTHPPRRPRPPHDQRSGRPSAGRELMRQPVTRSRLMLTV